MRVAGWVVIPLIMLGCSTTSKIYPGPRRPASEVATLSASPRVVIMSLNAHPMNGSAFEMLPGHYDMKFRVRVRAEEMDFPGAEGQRMSQVCGISFDAQPGHAYEVRMESPKLLSKKRTYTETEYKLRTEPTLIDRVGDAQSASPAIPCEWMGVGKSN